MAQKIEIKEIKAYSIHHKDDEKSFSALVTDKRVAEALVKLLSES
jgi:hypothetical protein